MWTIAVVILLARFRTPHDRSIVLGVGRALAVGMPMWVAARLSIPLLVPWGLRALVAAVLATVAVRIFILREPEMRIWRRLTTGRG